MTTRTRAIGVALFTACALLLVALAATWARAPDSSGIDADEHVRALDERASPAPLVEVDEVPAAPVHVESARTPAVPTRARPRGAGTEPRAPMEPERIRVPLHVSVVDEYGAPIEGARVRARITRSPPAGERASRATTDRHGAAVLEAEGCTAAMLDVQPAEDDRAHGLVASVAASCFGLTVVTLPTRHWLRVEAVDQHGAPVTAIERVHVRAPPHPGIGREVVPKSSTGGAESESSTGRYEIEVGPEAGIVRLESSRCGAVEHAYDPSAPSTMSARVVFRRDAALRVRTVRDGLPRAGVRVALGTAYPRDCGRIEQVLHGYFAWYGDHGFASQTTDADGWAEFAIDRPREHVVLAESIEFGTATTAVTFERLGRVVETVLELDDGCALDMVAVDARHKPVPGALVDLFGPGNTRRVATADDAGRCRANAMPRGRWQILGVHRRSYGRSPIGEGIVVEVGSVPDERIEVPTEARAYLAVASATRAVELYADGCPPIRIAPLKPSRVGAVQFASDHVGRHHVVVREKRDARIFEIDLVEGENELRVDAWERDARVEFAVGWQFTGSNHWVRTIRPGAMEFRVLRKGKSTLEDRSQRLFVWQADVAPGAVDLVHVDPVTGALEIVAGDLSFTSGETRRVVLEGFGK